MKLLLHTCTIIWAVAQPDRLSSRAVDALTQPDSEVSYSPMSCAEVAWAVSKNRLRIAQHWRTWFRHHVTANGWQELPIDLEMVQEAYSLPEPFHADPVDRLLVGTARTRSLTLVTADLKILEYPHVRTLW